MKWWLYLFALLVFCISVSSSNINILTYRDNYRPLETFQAEILLDKEPFNDLTNLNFEIYKGKAIGTLLSLEKISSKRYFIYFDIPNLKNGEYFFRVKNVDFVEDGVLKRYSEEKTIEIRDINPGFGYLAENQNEEGDFGSIAETSLSALALKNINNEKANQAIDYLLNNQDPTGCYPRDDCNVKDTSHALLALSKFNQNYIRTRNWLKDASNNFNLGIWNLRMNGNAVCGTIQLNGAYDLNLAEKEINITCNSNVNFILTHNYLGNSYRIHEYSGDNFYYSIDDSGCYGLGYKEKCDYISTLYASWALKSINENIPVDYLRSNRQENRTIDHALGYLIYNDDYDREWLFNNYLNGYWSYNSASISQQPDYFVSALATISLKNEFLFDEAKNYLEDKTESNILDSSSILHLLFDDETNLPSISINPGIVNKKNSFNLFIRNNKNPMNIFIDSPNSTNIPFDIYLEDSISYNYIKAEGTFEIVINYGNYSYTIPVIGQNVIVDDELPLLPPPRNAIRFLNEDANLSIGIDDSLNDGLSFTNNWNFPLEDIILNTTGNLDEILKFEKNYFERIDSNETLTTTIYLNDGMNPSRSFYEGYIIVRSSKKTIDFIKMTVKFNGTPLDKDSYDSQDNSEEEEDINQTKDSAKPSNNKENTTSSLWWLWLIAIMAVGFLLFMFFRRKKEVTENFSDYINRVKK